MPASPATPRRSSKNRRSTPVTPLRHEITSYKPLEVSDSNLVRDRIRQWQEQGAKLVSAPVSNGTSVAGDENAGLQKPLFLPQRENKLATGAADTTPRRRSRRWVDPDNREWVREARSTPRKRVLSDEHWRKKKQRSPRSTDFASRQEENHETGQETRRKTQQAKRHSDVKPHTSLKIGRSEKKSRREYASFSTGSGTRSRESAQMVLDTVLPPTRSCSSKEEGALQTDLDSGADDDLPARLRHRVSMAQPVEGGSDSPRLSQQANGKAPRLSQYAEMADKSAKIAQDTSVAAADNRKNGFLSHAKEVFSRSTSTQASSQRLPSIEAWLDEQPDPFMDGNPEPVEIPTPLSSQPSKLKVDANPKEVKDPNKIWSYVDLEDHRPSSRGHRRRNKSRRSPDGAGVSPPESANTAQVVEEAPRVSPIARDRTDGAKDASVIGLKRRGARVLRVKADSSSVDLAPSEHNPKPTIRASVAPENAGTDVALSAEKQPKPVKSCPPTGVHRLSTIASVETFGSHSEAQQDVNLLTGDSKCLQRRLTTHEDLMSMLSRPRAGGSIKSARSIRTTKSRMSTASLDDVFEELEFDEAKYMRELRTLVDGVIPVLLRCVLSKTDSAAAAGLFSSSGSAQDVLNFTRPIVDMGVALERLKTLHRRIPTRDINSLLSWAQSAHKVYLEYLKAWRLGFQDVIVNLAHPDDHTGTDIDDGMARDENGDVVNSKGEKVDVAYLLKRPLVRIKKLAHAFARMKILRPSAKASMVADEYGDLIKKARRRSHEEQSRLEDELAANIDTTKARDVRTLAVLTGVKVDRSRRVKARDCFSLTVHHSSGQRLDCQIELLLRDNQPGSSTGGGDLLICEVEDNGKWLLFPPVDTGSVSARYGDKDGEIVIMVRGLISHMHEWHELFLLTTSDIEAAAEWVTMLGTQPLPPKLNRSSSFVNRHDRSAISLLEDSTLAGKRLPLIPRSPSPQQVEVPIGEPSIVGDDEHEWPRTSPTLYQHGHSYGYTRSDLVSHEHGLPQIPSNNETNVLPALSDLSFEYQQSESPHTPLSDASSPMLRRAKGVTKRRTRRGESAHSGPLFDSSPTYSTQPTPSSADGEMSRTDNALQGWMTSPDVEKASTPDRGCSSDRDLPHQSPPSEPQRPQYHRAVSSTPSKELPIIHRLRPSSSVSTALTQSAEYQWSALSSIGAKSKQGTRLAKIDSTEENVDSKESTHGKALADDAQGPVPVPVPHRAQAKAPVPPEMAEAGPMPPPHGSSANRERPQAVPTMKIYPLPSPGMTRRNDRRSSSPLKHEYAPSTASGSDESDDESIASSSTGTSEEVELEQRDRATPLPPFNTVDVRKMGRVRPPSSLPNLPSGSLAPSNSASQAPYRTVPQAALQADAPPRRTLATVYSWSDRGVWELLQPSQCSIVVSPGLIEAYQMSAAHSAARTTDEDGRVSDGRVSDGRVSTGRVSTGRVSTGRVSTGRVSTGRVSDGMVSDGMVSDCSDSDDQGIRPLVAFELTPLVPLRRGTALDISIRSPPTARSKVKTSTNAMFRSRNAEECEALYAMINHARINNPTWIALQNARPREMPAVTFNTGPGSARHSRSRSRSGSWFRFGSGGKKSSYRASSTPPSGSPSIGGMSDSSVGSMSSAFSALRRFSGVANGGKGMFNLKRSSVIRRNGRFGTSGSASLYSSSSATSRTGGSGSDATSTAPSHLGVGLRTADQPAGSAPNAPGGTVNDMKIRLYVRESAARWRDLGSARLSVMPAPAMIRGNAEGSGNATDNDPSPPGTAGGSRPPSTFIVGQAGQASGPRLPSSNHTPHRVHGNGNEKRILITGTTKGETLLDATLHESCFERIARTGIAVSVWEEHEEVAKSGGVVGGKGRTYMVQMKGEAEAAWVFGMVGRLRY